MALINPTDIAIYCPEMPNSITDDNKKVKTYIDHAEIQDLRPKLGFVFWKEIIDNTSGNAAITALLNGGDYEYSGKTYENPGLKEVIARFAFARYAFFGSSTQTSGGSLVKTNQDARETTYQEKKDRHNTNRQIAFDQWGLVYDFLCRNSADYPLFTDTFKRTKRKFSIVTK